MENMIFYELFISGRENKSLYSKLYGTKRGYCLNNSCKFKDIRSNNEIS